jgi:tetratricopeptide (TPR) repeat protein
MTGRRFNPPARRTWLRFVAVSLLPFLGLTGCHAPGTRQNIAGVQYFQQGQPQAAIYQFQQSLARNPQNPDAYYNLAATYHYLGKQNADRAVLQQAETLYHQCLDLSPDHVACHRGLAVLLVDTNRPQSAFTLLERWTSGNPHIADARIELARLHEEFGEADEARRYLSQAIDVDPTSSRAWTAMAQLREQDGQLAQALSNYQQAYALNNFQPGVAQRIASLQQRVALDGPTAAPRTRLVETPRGWTQR